METIIEKIRAEVERRKGYISVTHFAEELLSFINSLQQEQPSEDLEVEIDRWFGEQYMQNMEGLPIKPIVQIIARHFAEWQKSQMLRGAVEGYVNYYEDSGGKLMAEAQVGCPYHIGDKVKIVIIPIKEDTK